MIDGRRGPRHLESRRNAATCLAMTGLLAIAAGLLALASLVLPRFAVAFILIVAGFGGFTLLHYLTWGRLLSRPRPGDSVDEEPEAPVPQLLPDDFDDD
jgi:hypothetical protein